MMSRFIFSGTYVSFTYAVREMLGIVILCTDSAVHRASWNTHII